jgi:hypothetical protein
MALRKGLWTDTRIVPASHLLESTGDELGTIVASALADVLLVDGDPSIDISGLRDPQCNLALIVADGNEASFTDGRTTLSLTRSDLGVPG